MVGWFVIGVGVCGVVCVCGSLIRLGWCVCMFVWKEMGEW